MQIEPDDQLDPIDEEHIRQVLSSRGFQIIAERIVQQRERAIAKLLTAELREVPGLQASIRTLQIVIETPKQILSEIKAASPPRQ